MQPGSRIMSCRGWLASVMMHALLGAALLAWHGPPPPPLPELAVPVELWSPPPEEPPAPAAPAPAEVPPAAPVAAPPVPHAVSPIAAKPLPRPHPAPVHRTVAPDTDEPQHPVQFAIPAHTSASTAVTDIAPPPPPRAAEPGASSEYMDAMQQALQEHLIYPAQSQRRREQGRVPMQVTLAADGTLLNAEPKGNSNPRLAQAAIDAVRASSPFARLPGRISPLIIDVVVHFDLD